MHVFFFISPGDTDLELGVFSISTTLIRKGYMMLGRNLEILIGVSISYNL
jgi:hypothetical protein